MTFTNIKERTPMLECNIIESILIICTGGASFRELEGYLNKKISNFNLKMYLFYLIELRYLSYGKPEKYKYFSERKGFDLMYDIYDKCMMKDISIDRTLITFESIIIFNNLSQFR